MYPFKAGLIVSALQLQAYSTADKHNNYIRGVIDMKNKIQTKCTFRSTDTKAIKAAVTAKLQRLVNIEAKKSA